MRPRFQVSRGCLNEFNEMFDLGRSPDELAGIEDRLRGLLDDVSKLWAEPPESEPSLVLPIRARPR